MNKTFTLKDLTLFTQQEKQLLTEVGLVHNNKKEGPSQRVIDNIQNYSKALSVRPSKKIGHIEMLLN